MLILARRLSEELVIDLESLGLAGVVTITVIRIDGNAVKLGVTAPRDVPVHRKEIYDDCRRSRAAGRRLVERGRGGGR